MKPFNLFISLWITTAFLFIFTSDAFAVTYFIAPGGNDNNLGTTTSPFKTFDKAMSSMTSGDTLILEDGIYTPANSNNSSWILGVVGKNNLTIKSKNDGGAIIDGQFIKTPVQIGGAPNISSYITIEGIVARNSYKVVFNVNQGSHHNTLRKVSGYDANPEDNTTIYLLWGNDNLIEDCVAAGTGRKMIEIYQYNNNTVRRCFSYVYYRNWAPPDCSKYCSTVWPNAETVQVYNSSNNIFENVIATGPASVTLINIQANDDSIISDNNKILGSIAVASGLNPITNTSQDYGPPPNNIVPVRDWSWLGQRSGMSLSGQGTLTNNLYKNVVMYGNNGLGFTASRPYNGAGSTVNNNTLENATIWENNVNGVYEPGSIGDGQATLAFVQALNTKIQNTSYNGEGAKIQYKYINSILTTDSLWPWPMEDRIKREFATLLTKYHSFNPKFTNYSITKEFCENILSLPSVNSVQSCYPNGPIPTTTYPTPTVAATIAPSPTPTPLLIPGKIEAENYNSYSGTLQILNKSSASGGQRIGNVGTNGGKLIYKTLVSTTSAYDFNFFTSSSDNSVNKTLSLFVDDESTPRATVAITLSGGWDTYKEHLMSDIYLTQGIHNITISLNSDYFDFDYFVISDTTRPTPTPTSSIPCPDLIGNTKRPDANGIPDCDKQIDILDFTYLSSKFGTNDPGANLDGIGNVTILDFTILANNFGKVL